MLLYFAIKSLSTASLRIFPRSALWVTDSAQPQAALVTVAAFPLQFFRSLVWSGAGRHAGLARRLQQTHLFWILDILCFAERTRFIINDISANQQLASAGYKEELWPRSAVTALRRRRAVRCESPRRVITPYYCVR